MKACLFPLMRGKIICTEIQTMSQKCYVDSMRIKNQVGIVHSSISNQKDDMETG